MKPSEFIIEALKYPEAPSDFTQIYNEFQIFQKAALSTLIEFHRVCEMNHINYLLFFGSLLGVVRDNGQIPWDYDIDVILPIEKKQSLIDALDKDLDSNFYYYCPESNRKCRHMIMRLAPKEYRTEALHVDVFFFTGTPEDKQEREVFKQKIKKVSEKRYGKFVNIREESAGNVRKYMKLLLKKKVPALLSTLSNIEKEYAELTLKYSSFNSSICVSADTYADWCEYPSDLLWDSKIVETDFGEIRIPIHFDELLKMMYGDYMSVPPIQQRIHEVLYNYHRIQFFDRRK